MIRLYLIFIKTTKLKSNKLMTIQTKGNSCKKTTNFLKSTIYFKSYINSF